MRTLIISTTIVEWDVNTAEIIAEITFHDSSGREITSTRSGYISTTRREEAAEYIEANSGQRSPQEVAQAIRIAEEKYPAYS